MFLPAEPPADLALTITNYQQFAKEYGDARAYVGSLTADTTGREQLRSRGAARSRPRSVLVGDAG